MTTNDKWINFAGVILPTLMVLAALIFTTILITTLHELEIKNNTKNRAMLCIVSVAPTQRSPEYVRDCYSQAEEANQINIERYGDAL